MIDVGLNKPQAKWSIDVDDRSAAQNSPLDVWEKMYSSMIRTASQSEM